TLGVTFNNFSLRNIFNRESWHPLPTGDGQKLSVRAQSNGNFYQSFNFSFTEPWMGGKKPNAFTLAAYTNKFTSVRNISNFVHMSQVTLGLGSPLQWPDNNFVINNTLNYQRINIETTEDCFRCPTGKPSATDFSITYICNLPLLGARSMSPFSRLRDPRS